ncbi:MAG TPA: SCO family protein [Pyrinomonadaceae bacterium]
MTKKFFLALALIFAVSAAGQRVGAQQPQQPARPRPTPPPQEQPQPQPAAPAKPHDHSQMHKKTAPMADPSAAQKYFSDVELLTQDGDRVRFYSDILKGKTVVINAFFTTCTTICPPMNRNMEKIQEAFGERIGKDLFLVSITVDPTTDTPPRLKEYAQKFNARPGWLFLTGKKENVDWALYKLGHYVEFKDQHTNIFIVGNEATGLWKKAFGMAKHDELVKLIQGVVDDKPTAN